MNLTVRPATTSDVDELVRLRAEVTRGERITDAWHDTYRASLLSRLPHDPDLVAFVLDAPEQGLASCAVAVVHHGLPSPDHPRGLDARIHNVATDPRYRRRGYTTLAVTALVEALVQRGCTYVELRSTAAGEALYRRLGFTGHSDLMVLRPSGRREV
ncbi:ribosomal protein S18 acetylase RimI-like enzyme [Streptomyces sp. SAI-126]|uniref:GNAT family N-acetyltransferase n=1 Tax=Streptomyces sp. SAI-126 TaxID=3377732 RepID=UPI003C7B8D98